MLQHVRPYEYKYLEMLFVNMECTGMSQDNIVAHNIRFGRRVSFSTEHMGENRAASRCLETRIVTLDRHPLWFVYCYPMLHSVSKLLKTCICILSEIFPVSVHTYIYLSVPEFIHTLIK